MTQAGSVVAWPRNVWHPEFVLRVPGTPLAAIPDLTTGLKRAGFSIRYDDEPGFRARRFSWFDLVTALDIHLTALEVRVHGADLRVRVVSGVIHRAARRRAARGLSNGVDLLRARGLDVEPTPWQVPVDRTEEQS